MCHARSAIAVVSATVWLTGCASAPPTPTGPLDGLEAAWFYVPGPYTTTQRVDESRRTASVGPERAGVWTVRVGEPATTIVVERLEDGRPATARIADARRDETVVFEPPLALVPTPGAEPPAAETTSISLYAGLSPERDLTGLSPTRTGTAERRFLGVEATTWTFDDRELPAQRLTHELVLKLSPATIRQTYKSIAVEELGIVEETLQERVIVFGVRISGRSEHVEVVQFDDER